MKYYSEMTDKVYDSVDELNADEKRVHEEELEFQRREQEKKAKADAEAKKMQEAIKAIDDAYKVYTDAVDAFRKKYGVTLSLRDVFPEIFDFIL